MTFWNFYFQLFPKSIRSPQVIVFLAPSQAYLRRPMLVIWAVWKPALCSESSLMGRSHSSWP